MKILKLYIPVVHQGVVKMKRSYRIQLIGVHNCTTILRHLPTTNEIFGHLQAQKYQMDTLKRPYTSIKIRLKPDDFEMICKEVTSKIGKNYQPPVIDLVFNVGQVPIIQMIKERVEPIELNVEKKVDELIQIPT
jgi:hypothetical protein